MNGSISQIGNAVAKIIIGRQSSRAQPGAQAEAGCELSRAGWLDLGWPRCKAALAFDALQRGAKLEDFAISASGAAGKTGPVKRGRKAKPAGSST
jgi:hypothetical protein